MIVSVSRVEDCDCVCGADLMNALLCSLIAGMPTDRSNRGAVTHTAAAAVHKKKQK